MTYHRQWFSYRGLSPHQFMPMLGVHNALKSDRGSATLHHGGLAQTLYA